MTSENDHDPLSAPKRATAPQPEQRDPLLEDDKPSFQFKMPRFVVPALGTVAGLFVLLFLIGLAVPFFVDFKALKDKALAEVQKSTGFEIKLADKIDFSLMPFPKVSVHDVVVRHPKDDPDHPLLRAKDVTVSVGMAGLWSGRVDVSKVDVQEAQVNLRQFTSIDNNWTPRTNTARALVMTDTAQTTPPTETAAPAFSLDTIALTNTAINFTPTSGQSSDVFVEDGELDLSGFDGPFDVRVKGTAFQKRLPIELNGSIGKITGTSAPSPLELDFRTDAGTIKLDGDLTLGEAPRYDGKADIDIADLSALMKALDPKAAPAPVKRFALKGDVSASAKAIRIKGGDVTLDEAHGPLDLELEGLGSDALSGTITTKLNVASFALAKGFKEIALQGQFSKQGDTTRIAPLDLMVDGQSVAGAVAIGKGGTSVNLTSQRLDLTPIMKAFDVKDMPDLVLNGLAVNAAMNGQTLVVNNLKIADVQGLAVAATGRVDDLAKGIGVKADVTASSQNLLASLKQFPQVTVPKEAEKYLNQAGSARVNYVGSFDAGNLNASVQAMGGSAGVKTGLSNLKTKPQTGGLTFVLAHPNTNAFLGMVSPGTKLGTAFNGAMNIEAGVEQAGDTWNINNLNAKLGGTTVAGNLAVKTGAVPFVSGSLNTGAIDIAQWFGAKETNAKTARYEGGSPLLIMAATGGERFTSAPMDLSWMNTLGLDLKLNAARLTSTPWVIEKPSLSVKLSGGALTISDLKGGFLGGTIAADVNATNTNGALSAKSTIKANNINLDPLTRTLVKTGKVVDGVGTMDLQVNTTGSSVKALVSGLSGSGTVKGTSLIIYGINVDSIVDAVTAVEDDDFTGALGLVTTNFRDGSSKFSDATIPLTIQNGVATWPATTLKSTRTDVITQGTLDFPAWRVDVQNQVVVTTKENRKIDAIQIATTGSIDNPQTKTDSSALTSKLKNRATKLIEKKIPDQYKGLIGGILGTTPATEEVVPVQESPVVPTEEAAPPVFVVPDTASPVEPVPPPAPEPEVSPEAQLLNGVINNVLGQ